MWDNDHIVHLQQRTGRVNRFFLEDIKSSASNPPFLQSLNQRRFINHRAT